MTKSDEQGENDITREAKRIAQQTGEEVCDILARWLKEAKAGGDRARQRRIIKAQKYLGCRNIQKRSK